MKFRTAYNYIQEQPENSEQPSLTVPGQSASIRELYARAMRGEPITHNNNLHYTGDELVPDFDHMDPVDRDNFIESLADLKEQIDENNKINEEQKMIQKQQVEDAMYQKWAEKYAAHSQTAVSNNANGKQATNGANDLMSE